MFDLTEALVLAEEETRMRDGRRGGRVVDNSLMGEGGALIVRGEEGEEDRRTGIAPS